MRYPSSIISFVLAVTTVTAAPPNYDEHILPVFENSCTNCHNPDKQKGDLDLTTYSAAMRGGSGGKFAEPGDGGDSKIYGVITHTLKPKMPPKGDKLGKKETDLIRAWIDGGLLENQSGKPQKKSKPAFVLSAAPGVGKPDGPPPMPQHLLLEPVVTTTRASTVADMATSPWAPLLAVTGQRQILLYHTDTLELVGILPFDYGQPQILSFHPSGKYLLAGGGIGGKSGTTVTWEIETGKMILRAGKDFDSVLAASLRADLGGISLGGPGKRVKLWNTSTNEQLVSIKKHTDWITQLSYSPDGVLLVSGGRGGGVYVWEAETGNAFHHLRGHKANITGVAWRSDSNLLATASEDGSVLIWEMNNGKQVKKISAHGGGVLSLDWNQHRGGNLVTSGRDKKVKIWKPDFNPLRELPAFSSLVIDVAFSHDGKRVFAADWDGLITVWDVATVKKVGTLAANPPSIVDRIQRIQKEIAAFPGKVESIEKTALTARNHHTTAKTALTQAEANHRNATVKHRQLLATHAKLDAELKTLDAQTSVLKKQRQQKQTELTQARDSLNQHNAELAATRRKHQQADNEVKKLVGQEKHLVQNEQNTRKKAQGKPDDINLQKAAAEAKLALDTLRRKLGEKRNFFQQQSTALARLTKQQKGPGNQLATANKAWMDTNTQWSLHLAQRKSTQEKRNALNQQIPKTQKLALSLKKAIKPTLEKLTQAEVTLKKTTTGLEHARHHINKLNAGLKHWQAATINADAIRLAQKLADLTTSQHQAMDDFTSLAAEIQQIKHPAKLKEKSRQLHQLRTTIDNTAPELITKQNQVETRLAEYHKVIKGN